MFRMSRRRRNLINRRNRLLRSLDPESPFDSAHRDFIAGMEIEIRNLERRRWRFMSSRTAVEG